MLADVGVTWYTWLEQGREVNPSEAVLVGVANALQCSPLETRHLFVLAGLTPPEATQVTVCEGISHWHPPDAGQPDAAAGQHSETEL